MFDRTNTYAEFDLNQSGLLPDDWVDEILKVAQQHSYQMHLDGKSSTSKEPHDTEGTDVFVVDGNIVFEKLSWLYNLYIGKLLAYANKFFRQEYEIDGQIVSSININYLKGKDARYEWHVDSNPLTGLLFVTDHDMYDGGELVFKLGDEFIYIQPRSGIFILFDARAIPHTVLPLKKEIFRISVPMNYFLKGHDRIRPYDLDNYIYKTPLSD